MRSSETSYRIKTIKHQGRKFQIRQSTTISHSRRKFSQLVAASKPQNSWEAQANRWANHCSHRSTWDLTLTSRTRWSHSSRTRCCSRMITTLRLSTKTKCLSHSINRIEKWEDRAWPMQRSRRLSQTRLLIRIERSPTRRMRRFSFSIRNSED